MSPCVFRNGYENSCCFWPDIKLNYVWYDSKTGTFGDGVFYMHKPLFIGYAVTKVKRMH